MTKESKVLDERVDEVVKNSKDETPVRVKIWNYLMEKDNHSTDDSISEMKDIVKESDSEIESILEDKVLA